MNTADLIDVKTNTEQPSNNILPILFEVRHAIIKWLKNGDQTVIDVLRLPLADGEDQVIEAVLGKGEVEVVLKVLGKSLITETAIGVVWMVTHYDDEEKLIGKTIEITDVPSILRSQFKDAELGLQKLDQLLLSKTNVTTISSNHYGQVF